MILDLGCTRGITRGISVCEGVMCNNIAGFDKHQDGATGLMDQQFRCQAA